VAEWSDEWAKLELRPQLFSSFEGPETLTSHAILTNEESFSFWLRIPCASLDAARDSIEHFHALPFALHLAVHQETKEPPVSLSFFPRIARYHELKTATPAVSESPRLLTDPPPWTRYGRRDPYWLGEASVPMSEAGGHHADKDWNIHIMLTLASVRAVRMRELFMALITGLAALVADRLTSATFGQDHPMISLGVLVGTIVLLVIVVQPGVMQDLVYWTDERARRLRELISHPR
jgi:hypothetical protein